MSALLDDIITLAADDKQPLPNILRKCLILGYELKDDRLKTWADQEINGYGDQTNIPAYRVVEAHAVGNFIGPGYSQYTGRLIPPAALEDRHRRFAEITKLIQSVGVYEDVISRRSSDETVASVAWPGDLVVYYQHRILSNGYTLQAAWQDIPISALIDLLGKIRSITLNLALQIKDELGTSYADLRRIEPGVASNIQTLIIQNTGEVVRARHSITVRWTPRHKTQSRSETRRP